MHILLLCFGGAVTTGQVYDSRGLTIMSLTKLPLAVLALLTTCLPAHAQVKDEDVPSVQVSHVTVNGVRLDSRESDIYKILGKPDKIIRRNPSEVLEGEAKDIYYGGLKIYLVGGEILRLECQGSSCITDKGIRIGDARAKVERAYGHASAMDAKSDSIYYVFKAGDKFVDSALVFQFKNGKLVKITYFVDYT